MTQQTLPFTFALTEAESRYSARHFEGQSIVERWFPSRDDRTAYVLSIGGASKLLSHEDPADDYSAANVYGPGKPWVNPS